MRRRGTCKMHEMNLFFIDLIAFAGNEFGRTFRQPVDRDAFNNQHIYYQLLYPNTLIFSTATFMTRHLDLLEWR